jgi:hypothetical protein
MKLVDKFAQHKMKKELKKWGLDDAEVNVDVSGISAEDMKKMEQQFKAFISKHPRLKNLKLDSLPDLLRHKDEIKRVLSDNKEDLKQLIATVKQSQEKNKKK